MVSRLSLKRHHPAAVNEFIAANFAAMLPARLSNDYMDGLFFDVSLWSEVMDHSEAIDPNVNAPDRQYCQDQQLRRGASVSMSIGSFIEHQ